MDREGIQENSINIWTKSIIEKYEERPNDLNEICLSDFVAWYTPMVSRQQSRLDDDHLGEPDDADDEDATEETSTVMKQYRRRDNANVIRCRGYDIEDTINYKREMVTLFHPFRNELVDILDRLKFKEIYDREQEQIMNKRKEYEKNINIDALMDELSKLCEEADDGVEMIDESEREQFVRILVRRTTMTLTARSATTLQW